MHPTLVRILQASEALKDREFERRITGRLAGRATPPKRVAILYLSDKCEGLKRDIVQLPSKAKKEKTTIVLKIMGSKKFIVGMPEEPPR